MTGYTFLCFAFVIISKIYLTNGQVPPRLLIPGAVLVSKPPQRVQKLPQSLSDSSQLPPTRLRKPIPNAIPVAIPIREEVEESISGFPTFNDDFPKPNIPAFVPLARIENDNEEEAVPRAIPFRPERPLPNLRQEIASGPPRAISRQNVDEEQNIPTRPIIPQNRRVSPQPARQPAKPQQRPPPTEYASTEEARRNKNRKPPVQILRKYRTDNDDGSITWGFENEDGTFKEETIGTDCVIRGKYGYIDPEGTKREYTYETGNKCDKPEEELPSEDLAQPNIPNIPNRPNVYAKRPVFKPA